MPSLWPPPDSQSRRVPLPHALQWDHSMTQTLGEGGADGGFAALSRESRPVGWVARICSGT